MAYSDWEYKDSKRVHRFFKDAMDLKGEILLDIGCGLGGRAIYYAHNGAKFIVGVDLNKGYIRNAKLFASKKAPFASIFFLVGDAAHLPFKQEVFGLICAHSIYEHIANSTKSLSESWRVLKKTGKACINFPPYLQPYGAHQYRHIYFPWPQVFFSQETLRNFFIQKTGSAKKLDEVNQMTIKRFKNLLNKSRFKKSRLRLHTKFILRPLLYLPFLQEYFTLQVISILEKKAY